MLKYSNRSDTEATFNILNMEDVIKKLEKQQRTPRNYESIEKGALALELKERVELRNKLTVSIDQEVKEMEEKLNTAKGLVNGA